MPKKFRVHPQIKNTNGTLQLNFNDFIVIAFWATVCKTIRPWYRFLVCPVLSDCNIGALWQNGWMDQDATWYGGRPRPRRLCVRWEPRSPLPKSGRRLQIFGPCLLWPNGWMDHDATWYEGYPQAEQHCVICGPSSNPKGHSCPFSARVCCGQTAGWIKMPLGMKVWTPFPAE